jgi:branched-chain amino acid transport system ATP-binding protein
MTVLDNVRLAAPGQRGERLRSALRRRSWRAQEQAVDEHARTLLARFGLAHVADDFAGTLSGGQRKLLELARALMARPRLVMLDEPMAGVNPALTQSLLGHIESLRDQGTTVLFVEHDMHMVRHISDWVVVMAEGRIVAEGPPATVMRHQAVVDAYLGSHHDQDLGDDAVLEEDFGAAVAAEEAARAEDPEATDMAPTEGER